MTERCPDPKCNSRFKERRFCVTDHVRNIPRPHCFVQDDCMECTDPWHGVASEPAPTPEIYGPTERPESAGATLRQAINREEKETGALRIKAEPAVERPTEQGLFVLGEFDLHSGAKANWKIDCDALTDSDIEALAIITKERLPAFGAVEGVAKGGLRLAAALQKSISVGPLLIVDDVLTTGASMEAQRNSREAIGVVIFARGTPSSWITPLFRMDHAELESELSSLINKLGSASQWKEVLLARNKTLVEEVEELKAALRDV